MKDKTDLMVVGHFAIDTIYKDGKLLGKFIGGPPTYVSLAAAKIGAKVSVLSKVGWDFGKNYAELLARNNVDLSFLKRERKAETTKFELRYSGWKRQLKLKAAAPSIRLEDVPKNLKIKAIHVAPIANEIGEDVVERLRKNSEILSLDPQGFIRKFDGSGNVYLKPWRKTGLIGLFDVYKSSFEELKTVTETSNLEKAIRKIADFGVRVVIVTLGKRGSALFFEDSVHRIPPAPSEQVKEVTGAGDAYIGGFLAEYVHEREVLWCACVGAAAASFVVEEAGSLRFGEENEVHRRALKVYRKFKRKSINER